MSDFGNLYVVATPIGNLGDISQRAIDILQSVDLIAAEDTRHSKKLLQNYQIDTPMVSHHDFSKQTAIDKLIKQLLSGKSLALISDAGTPLISDPGYKLVFLARQEGISVLPIPGASAVTAALCASGLATDKFVFEGFLPAKSGARKKRLLELSQEARTLAIYESPHRILPCVVDMQQAFGEQRQVFIARELTKKFESHFFGNLAESVYWLEQDANNQRGEFVVIIAGCDDNDEEKRKQQQALEIVALLSKEVSMKKAVSMACQITGARKNQLYDSALRNIEFDAG